MPSDGGGFQGFLIVECMFSVRLLDMVIPENTPSNAGGFQGFLTVFRPRQFSLSYCPSCSYRPDCPGAVALKRRGAFPDCRRQSPSGAGGLFPTAGGSRPQTPGGFPPAKAGAPQTPGGFLLSSGPPLARTSARMLPLSQHTRVTRR